LCKAYFAKHTGVGVAKKGSMRGRENSTSLRYISLITALLPCDSEEYQNVL